MSSPSPTRREFSAIVVMAVLGLVSGSLGSLLPPAIAWMALGGGFATLATIAMLVSRRLRQSTRRLDKAQRAMSKQLAEHSRRLASVSEDLGVIVEQLAPVRADVSHLSDELTRFIQVTSGIEDELYELNMALNERSTAFAEHLNVLRSDTKKVTRNLETIYRRHDQLQRKFKTGTQQFATKRALANVQRSAVVMHRLSVLSDAFRLSERRRPRCLLILVTVERSGSTALFDLMRSHPKVYVEPLSFLWEEMGFEGRRYPTSLSDQGRYTLPVEVQPGIGARIPMLDGDQSCHRSGRTTAIEKAHPQFINHDPQRLTDGIARMKEFGTEVELVVQVRRPLDVMWSMAEFKRRDPSWYPDLQFIDIPTYVLTSLQSLQRILEEQLPHVRVIDNSDLVQVSQRLVDLVEHVGPIEGGTTGEWVERTLEHLTGMQESTPFVAARDTPRRPEGPERVWADASQAVHEATVLWERILSDDVG